MDILIDLLVIVIIAYSARVFCVLSKRKETKKLKLLFKVCSLFIIFHFILFPIIYVILINTNSDSISIEDKIIRFEKKNKLANAKSIKEKIISDPERNKKFQIVRRLLREENDTLVKVDWKFVDNKRILFIDSFLISGFTKYREIASDRVDKVIRVYDISGAKKTDLITYSEEEVLSEILKEHLKEIDAKKIDLENEIKKIEANKFWSYRQILPYTMNIVFTSNFNPQSRISNIIYFIHNLFIIGFLFSLITRLTRSAFKKSCAIC